MFSLPDVFPARRRSLVLASVFAALVVAAPASAGQPVVQQLNPEPPDFYTCSAVGAGTICRAETSDPYAFEPSGIWCGSGAGAFEVLDSGGHTVRATRWYDAGGNLTRRQRIHDFPGAHFTNPLTGFSIDYQQRNTDWELLATPGDLGTASFDGHGVLSMTLPGAGAILLEAGVAKVSSTGELELQAGPADLSAYFAGDASAVDALCAALIAG